MTGIDPRNDASELRKLAENEIRFAPDGQYDEAHPLSADEARHALHELRVHQIELEMQNEELRQAQSSLDACKDRYFDLFDMAPVGYLTVDDTGAVLEANLKAAELLGVVRSDLVGRLFSHFVKSEDQDILFFNSKRLRETKLPTACDLRLAHADGVTAVWVHIEATMTDIPGCHDVFRVALSDITELKESQDVLRRQFDEEKILLRETHHRIKNNIATIKSMLTLQSRFTDNQEAVSIINEAIGRLEIMRELYDKMLIAGDDGNISVKEYLTALVRSIVNLFAGDTDIAVEDRYDDFYLESKQLFPLGIIANELITNSLKYAFKGKDSGILRISATIDIDTIQLIVSDDGTGLPADFSIESHKGFGLMLIDMLARQLNGSFALSGDKGTIGTLVFKKTP